MFKKGKGKAKAAANDPSQRGIKSFFAASTPRPPRPTPSSAPSTTTRGSPLAMVLSPPPTADGVVADPFGVIDITEGDHDDAVGHPPPITISTNVQRGATTATTTAVASTDRSNYSSSGGSGGGGRGDNNGSGRSCGGFVRASDLLAQQQRLSAKTEADAPSISASSSSGSGGGRASSGCSSGSGVSSGGGGFVSGGGGSSSSSSSSGASVGSGFVRADKVLVHRQSRLPGMAAGDASTTDITCAQQQRTHQSPPPIPFPPPPQRLPRNNTTIKLPLHVVGLQFRDTLPSPSSNPSATSSPTPSSSRPPCSTSSPSPSPGAPSAADGNGLNIPPDTPLELEREPLNNFDRNAIKVILPPSLRGRREDGFLGYIPGRVAALLAPLIDTPVGTVARMTLKAVGEEDGDRRGGGGGGGGVGGGGSGGGVGGDGGGGGGGGGGGVRQTLPALLEVQPLEGAHSKAFAGFMTKVRLVLLILLYCYCFYY